MSVANYQLRFYEHDPSVKFAVEFLFTFPNSFQDVIANGMSHIAIRDFQANTLVKSLGKEKILALYASRQKRRAYDRLPAVHQAMSYLMMLPEEKRRVFAGQLNDLTGPAFSYLRDCEVSREIPQLEVLERMVTIYMQKGNEYLTQFSKAIRAALQKPSAEQPAASNPEQPSRELFAMPLDRQGEFTVRELSLDGVSKDKLTSKPSDSMGKADIREGY